MQKSISIPNNLCMAGQVKNTPIRKSVSTNALTILDVQTNSIDLAEAMLVSNAPIHQAALCVLPNAVASNFKVDEEVMACLVTPLETPEIKAEPERTIGRNRKYLQLATENEEIRNKYLGWLARARKMKRSSFA